MTLSTQAVEAAPGGINVAFPGHEIQDHQAICLQDCFVDYPGLIRRRGPLAAVGGVAALSSKASGLVSTIAPNGQYIIGALNGDNSNGRISLFNADMSAKTDLAWAQNFPNGVASTVYTIVDQTPALGGGAWIGTSTSWDSASPTQSLVFWKGGINATYTTGTLTVARGSTAVTGSGTTWTTNISPGMFLFANTNDPYTNAYIGVVASVTSNTALTLMAPSPYASTTKTYICQSLRGFAPKVTKGRITCATGSTTVTGGATKWISQKINSGTWQLYRATDFAFVGKVSSVTNDTSLTLAASAAVSMSNEKYVLIRVDSNFSQLISSTTDDVGFLTAAYADRQWYANRGTSVDATATCWFSDPTDPESLDMSPNDGDFIQVDSATGPHTPIKAIAPAVNALIVLKDTECFAIFGKSAATFNLKKIGDDGTLDTGSVQTWNGGVIWAGREGLNFYDGIQITNLTENTLGNVWKDFAAAYRSNKNRMYSFIHRDKYFLHIDKNYLFSPVIKTNSSSGVTNQTICLDLRTNAITLMSNLAFRGAAHLSTTSTGSGPSLQGGGANTFVIVNDTVGRICDAGTFIISGNTGADTVTCDSANAAGPDFFFESKKYSMKDSLRRKLFKQLAVWYLTSGGNVVLDTIIGLNETAITATATFPNSSGVWARKRIKFTKRDSHLSFRLYQSGANTDLQIGPFEIGFTWQRPGRV